MRQSFITARGACAFTALPRRPARYQDYIGSAAASNAPVTQRDGSSNQGTPRLNRSYPQELWTGGLDFQRFPFLTRRCRWRSIARQRPKSVAGSAKICRGPPSAPSLLQSRMRQLSGALRSHAARNWRTRYRPMLTPATWFTPSALHTSPSVGPAAAHERLSEWQPPLAMGQKDLEPVTNGGGGAQESLPV